MLIVVLVALNKSQLEHGITHSIQLNTSSLPTSRHSVVLSSVRFTTTTGVVSMCPMAMSFGSMRIEEIAVPSDAHRKSLEGAEGPFSLGPENTEPVVDATQ